LLHSPSNTALEKNQKVSYTTLEIKLMNQAS
jgi:hypothetical protein